MSGQVYSVPFAQIPEWILDAEISDRAVRLFCVLHRHANEDGRAFPGRSAIAKRMRCSTPSIDRALNELRDIGALTSVQKKLGPAIVGNDYWLWPASPLSPVTTPSVTRDATVESPVTLLVESPVTRLREREPSNESQGNESHLPVVVTSDAPLPASKYPPDFEAFWSPYPRKDDKADAFKAWPKALKAADGETIAAGAVRYANDPNRLPEYTKLPATWLNKRSWENGPLPSRTNESRLSPTQAKERRSLDAADRAGVRALRDGIFAPTNGQNALEIESHER